MFIDRARIYIKAGNGGKGCESFYYKRGMRYRRRDGGNGGIGGNVIMRADPNVHTLLDFRYRQHFKAESGKHGGSNLKNGSNGEDRIILVPPGTIIRDEENGLLIRDLNSENEQVIAVKGGAAGKGNYRGRPATEGGQGQEKIISLELKLIADVGLIGYPNAGKSSFVNTVSEAKSKVANFPFTTICPVLGVVKSSQSHKRFVVADIPGIIKDAHKGKGLGLEFLRHIERTKLLLFLIDMSAAEGRQPVDDYLNLINEIESYDMQLMKRPRVLVANKMDLPASKENLKDFKAQIKEKIYRSSCISGEGIQKITEALFKKLNEAHRWENV
ncbi:MAG: Obg family GTPase CgtA [Candidatus Omnitrophica bacterium]|nr:Obg family GTPase CgtA [Candidatus Omnitrophota bacterium]